MLIKKLLNIWNTPVDYENASFLLVWRKVATQLPQLKNSFHIIQRIYAKGATKGVRCPIFSLVRRIFSRGTIIYWSPCGSSIRSEERKRRTIRYSPLAIHITWNEQPRFTKFDTPWEYIRWSRTQHSIYKQHNTYSATASSPSNTTSDRS